MGEAAFLRQTNEVLNSLTRLIRVDLDLDIQPRAASVNGPLQDRAPARRAERLLDCSLAEVDPGELRAPRKLGEQSKRDGCAEVSEGRGSRVAPAQAFTFVAHHQPCAAGAFAVYF